MFNLTDILVNRFKAVFKQYFSGLKVVSGRRPVEHARTAGHRGGQLPAVYLHRGQGGRRRAAGGRLHAVHRLASISGGIASLITTTAIIYEGTLFIENMIIFMKEKASVVCRLNKPAELKRHIALHRVQKRLFQIPAPTATCSKHKPENRGRRNRRACRFKRRRQNHALKLFTVFTTPAGS